MAAFTDEAQSEKTDFADDMMKEIVTEALADGVAPARVRDDDLLGEADNLRRTGRKLSYAKDKASRAVKYACRKKVSFEQALREVGAGDLAPVAPARGRPVHSTAIPSSWGL